jgi:hypothetical protein
MTRNFLYALCAVLVVASPACASRKPARQAGGGGALPRVTGVQAQPLLAQAVRIREAMDYLGSPLSDRANATLNRAATEMDEAKAIALVQDALDPHCLLGVNINPEARVKVAQGPAKPVLVEQGWRVFLVKVENQAGVTAELKAVSPNSQPTYRTSSGRQNPPPPTVTPAALRDRWMELVMFNTQPLRPALSGLPLEYRIVQLYTRDAGKREGKISFNVGQGTQDIGFRNEADILFDCQPSSDVTFRVKDADGKPLTAMFLVRDKQGRVYPSQSRRLAPDFPFHPQVYRADGEKIRLPKGEYTVDYARGPEYLAKTVPLSVTGKNPTASFRLERWVDPSKLGWWSGDHHIHAAGCQHYEDPTEGVLAPDMARHCQGEDLKVGCNLTWGPCFDFQKQFFTGQIDKSSKYPYLLRYDVEVSGFGSHQSGHLCLLRLKDQIYPGGDSWKHWPTLGLNTLKWAKKQGAVCGPAHSGNGIQPPDNNIPSYSVPQYNGIGANEYIVDVTHDVPGPDGKLVPAVDFISTVDTSPSAELNMWYHTLNCGFRTRISGETDFPCIFGERVGIGRSYVKLDGTLDFDRWCEGVRQGRSYVSDGKSHLMEFKAGSVAVGENGSELRLTGPDTVRLTAKVAALLPETPDKAGARRYPWHLEKARVGETREVPVEVIVNGYPVAQKNVAADGTTRDVAFDVKIDRSSWVALRILPSSHTNPVFVLVDGKPIRASKRSADWCIKGVEQCWKSKQRTYAAAEQDDAVKAYDHALATYRRILSECEVD